MRFWDEAGFGSTGPGQYDPLLFPASAGLARYFRETGFE